MSWVGKEVAAVGAEEAEESSLRRRQACRGDGWAEETGKLRKRAGRRAGGKRRGADEGEAAAGRSEAGGGKAGRGG